MLRRENRLRRERDFRSVLRRGRRLETPDLSLHVLRADHTGLRLGFVVGRRIGSAVVRNRVKRLLREACRIKMLHMCPGFDIVFVARASLRGQPFDQVCEQVMRLLRQAGVLINGKGSMGETGQWGSSLSR